MKIKVFLLGLLMLILCTNIAYAAVSDSEIVSVTFLNQNPDPACAGEIVEIRLRVENLGGKEVNNLELELLPEYPFSKISGEEYLKKIEPLAAYQSGANAPLVKFRVRVDQDAIEGINKIEVREGRTGSTFYTSKTISIDVVSREFAEIIYIDKAKIMPGKETEMTFTIHNTGNAPLQNMIFSWSEENDVVLPVGTDNSRYIKYLSPGNSIDLKYTVIGSVNANPDLYKLDLSLEYEVKDESGVISKETVSTKAGVFVGGETDFDVTFSESSAGQTSLSVANTGNNPALSTTVRIPEQENFIVSGSTSSIIGNLDKGDYTIVSFQISQRTGIRIGTSREQISQLSDEQRQKLREQLPQVNVSQINNLKVLIEYTDTTGERQTVEKNVPIHFRTLTGEASASGQNMQLGQFGRVRQQQNPWLTPIIAVILVIAGIIYYKKRKIVNPFLKTFINKFLNRLRSKR